MLLASCRSCGRETDTRLVRNPAPANGPPPPPRGAAFPGDPAHQPGPDPRVGGHPGGMRPGDFVVNRESSEKRENDEKTWGSAPSKPGGEGPGAPAPETLRGAKSEVQALGQTPRPRPREAGPRRTRCRALSLTSPHMLASPSGKAARTRRARIKRPAREVRVSPPQGLSLPRPPDKDLPASDTPEQGLPPSATEESEEERTAAGAALAACVSRLSGHRR